MKTKTLLLTDINRNNIENIFNINFDKVTLEIPFEHKYFISQDNENKLITFKNLANKVKNVKIKLEDVIEDIIELCSSDIVKHSMKYFMEGFTKEDRYIIAKSIAKRSYLLSKIRIEQYFNNK